MIDSPSCAYNLKCVGAHSRRGKAPALPFPFCLSHGLDVALNSTEQMRFPQTQLHKDTTMGCIVL